MMIAKSTDRKTFQLIENDQQIGELIYENMFFLNAEIKLTNSEVYIIKSVDMFQSSITVTKDGNEIANLKMNWSGHIVLTFQDGQIFVLKAKNLFHPKFAFENRDKETIIQFDPKFNWTWNKFHCTYEISYNKKPHNGLFVLLGVYASTYFIANMTGANYGMA